MKKVTFNNNTVALGLYWARLSGEKLKAEMAALADEVNKPFGFTRKVETEEGEVSYQAALTEEKSLKGVISGAAALADKYQDLIFIESIEDSIWICAISNHEVLAGGDRIVSTKDAQEAFDDLLSAFGDDSDDLIIVQSELASEKISIDSDESLDFDALITNADVEKFSKEFSGYKIDSAKQGSNTILLGIIAAMAVGAAGYHFVGPGFGPNAAPAIVFPEQITAPRDQIIVKPAAKESKQTILDKAYAQEVSWIRSDFNKSDPVKTIMRLIAFDTVNPRHVAGWSVREIKFDRKRPRSIQVLWKRARIGTPISLRQALTGASAIKVRLDGNAAVSVHNVVDKFDNGYGSDFDIVGFIRSNGYKHENMMHDLISMNYIWEMSPYVASDRPQPIEGIKNSQKASIRQLNLSAKNIIIGGTSRDDLTAFINILNSAPTFKLKTISINLEAGFQWSIDGELYEN